MNSRISGTIKNIGYVFSSNFFKMAISFIIAMIIPKALGVEEYGYLQLYVFYASYVGLFHFGLADGVYLRYGGMNYSELNKPLLHSQFIFLIVMQGIIAFIIFISSFFYMVDPKRIFIMFGVSVCCVLTTPCTMLLFLLQTTGRVKDYAKNTIAEKIVYACIVLSMVLIFKVREFQFLVLADLLARLFTAIYFACVCRDIVFSKSVALKESFAEVWVNVRVGVNLLIAQISGSLVLGIVRFAIERCWDVSTFGKVSVSLTVSNLILVFISATGIVMFPVIKRMTPENRGENYGNLRFFLVTLMLGAMIACYPARALLVAWLPQYTESAVYLVILFPLCLFEGKVTMLTNNYLKALRLEKTMLRINIFSVAVSFCTSFVCAYLLRNLTLSVLSLIVNSAFRCILSEIIISKEIGISLSRDILCELFLIAVFIYLGWFANGFTATMIYMACYAAYLYMRKKNIRNVIRMVTK